MASRAPDTGDGRDADETGGGNAALLSLAVGGVCAEAVGGGGTLAGDDAELGGDALPVMVVGTTGAGDWHPDRMSSVASVRATPAQSEQRGSLVMWVLILEAMLALALLIFIVWWTMAGGSQHAAGNEAASESKADRDADAP